MVGWLVGWLVSQSARACVVGGGTHQGLTGWAWGAQPKHSGLGDIYLSIDDPYRPSAYLITQVVMVERQDDSGPGGMVRELWFRGGEGAPEITEEVLFRLSWFLPKNYHLLREPQTVRGSKEWAKSIPWKPLMMKPAAG